MRGLQHPVIGFNGQSPFETGANLSESYGFPGKVWWPMIDYLIIATHLLLVVLDILRMTTGR